MAELLQTWIPLKLARKLHYLYKQTWSSFFLMMMTASLYMGKLDGDIVDGSFFGEATKHCSYLQRILTRKFTAAASHIYKKLAVGYVLARVISWHDKRWAKNLDVEKQTLDTCQTCSSIVFHKQTWTPSGEAVASRIASIAVSSSGNFTVGDYFSMHSLGSFHGEPLNTSLSGQSGEVLN
ncbi:hypothetical protein Dimus_020291 [Dionaea muscipula]